MRDTPFGDFVDTVSTPTPADPVARDRQIERACYGEPTTPEGGGIGLLLTLWLVFAIGTAFGSYLARLGQ